MSDSNINPDRTPINNATVCAYRDAARRVWHRGGEIEIDDFAEISRGDDNGAYVQAWVWVCDDQLEAPAGPSYDVWIAEEETLGGDTVWEWRFDSRFTCEDDPDGKGARRSAHEYARNLRQTYHCAYVAVRPAGNKPLPVRSTP